MDASGTPSTCQLLSQQFFDTITSDNIKYDISIPTVIPLGYINHVLPI